MSTETEHADQLRAARLRVTRPRIAVLGAVHDHPHADTDTIFGAVRAELPDVSRQAVYDVLRRPDRRGPGASDPAVGFGGPLRIAGRRQPPSLVCRSCGDIDDVDCAVGETPCLTPSGPEWTASSSTRPRSSTGVCAPTAAATLRDFGITTVITAQFTTPGRKCGA